jgi:hypothetical protein
MEHAGRNEPNQELLAAPKQYSYAEATESDEA